MSVPTTTAQDVVDTFTHTDRARTILSEWQRSRPRVAQLVMNHSTVAAYRVTVADLQAVARRTEHALGDVKKARIQRATMVTDWNPEFALTHFLHHALEERGAAFTYQEFREFAAGNDVRWILWEPAQQQIEDASKSLPEDVARDAMRWRIGNGYYAFLKELYVVANLREQGIDVRLHPLADALFRVDAWVGKTALSIYVGNPQFRDESQGRKPLTGDIIEGAGFEVLAVNPPPATRFGQVTFPTTEALDAAAHRLLE